MREASYKTETFQSFESFDHRLRTAFQLSSGRVSHEHFQLIVSYEACQRMNALTVRSPFIAVQSLRVRHAWFIGALKRENLVKDRTKVEELAKESYLPILM